MSGKIGDNPYRASGVVAAAAGGGAVEWCSTVKTGAFCAAAGRDILLILVVGPLKQHSLHQQMQEMKSILPIMQEPGQPLVRNSH